MNQNNGVFDGRASRSEFWGFYFVNLILIIVFQIIEIDFLHLAYIAIALMPSIVVSIRRMHDVGKSGWFILIPFYNIILAIKEGDMASNEYGEPPSSTNNLTLDSFYGILYSFLVASLLSCLIYALITELHIIDSLNNSELKKQILFFGTFISSFCVFLFALRNQKLNTSHDL